MTNILLYWLVPSLVVFRLFVLMMDHDGVKIKQLDTRDRLILAFFVVAYPVGLVAIVGALVSWLMENYHE